MSHRNKTEIERDIQRTKLSIKRLNGYPVHLLESDLKSFRDEWTNAAMRGAKQ